MEPFGRSLTTADVPTLAPPDPIAIGRLSFRSGAVHINATMIAWRYHILAVAWMLLVAGASATAVAESSGASAFFAQLDGDASGTISVDEWTAATWSVFASADQDGDGQIRRAEFADAADDDRAERVFSQVDLDGDGRITRAEVDQVQAARFAALDANGDGVVTRGELAAE